MAQSKFLKWQDTNGDGLIDACDDKIDVKEVPVCPECKPNPNYLTPNWKTKDQNDPWYDEKKAEFHITVKTNKRSLIEDGDTDEEAAKRLQAYFKEYEEEAIEGLLIGFNKLDSEKIRESLRAVIEYQKSYLGDRQWSRVQLLYSIPCQYFFNLPDLFDDEDDADEEVEEADASGDVRVTYNASEIAPKLLKFRKAMHLYARYYRVYQAIDGGVLVIQEGENKGKIFSKDEFDKYGDRGKFGGSVMYSLLKDLDVWLNGKRINIYRGTAGDIRFNQDRAERIEFVFSSEYELKKLKVWTVECGNKPVVFGKKRISSLIKKESWKDPRACAYFAQLSQLELDLTAREALPWLEVIERYTYPRVLGTKNYGAQPMFGALSCIGDALSAEGKQLGQELTDSVFSIGDAIAYNFNQRMCYPDQFEEEVMREGMGLTDPTRDWANGMLVQPLTKRNVFNMAMDQAFGKLECDGAAFGEFCASFSAAEFEAKVDNVSLAGTVGVAASAVNEMWRDSLERLKKCGLTKIMLDSIKCLFSGMSLEMALGTIVGSALKSLSIENFGILTSKLPPEKQMELDALVKKKLQNSDMFPVGSGAQELSDNIIPSDFLTVPPWESVTPQERKKSLRNLQDATNIDEKEQHNVRTLAQRLDKPTGMKRLSNEVLLEAYILAYLELFRDNYLDLVDELNKFPGAQMIARVIVLFDCPRPPVFQPNFVDFIKSINDPFCTTKEDIRYPVMLHNPLEWVPKKSDISKYLMDAARLAIQRILVSVLMKLIVKLCTLLADSICNSIQLGGDLASSLPDLATGKNKNTIRDIIKESICGESASDQQIDDTLSDMFEKFGVGGAAFSNQERVMQFWNDVSSTGTRKEITSAVLGNVSDELASIIDNLLDTEYQEFRQGLPNKDAVASLFTNVGNLLPLDMRAAMGDFVDGLPEDDFLPANPTLCATSEQLDDFCSMRASLLEGRATATQAREMCTDFQNERAEDLSDIADVLQGGPLQGALPPIVSDPGCNNGLFPFESEENQKTTSLVLGSSIEQLKVEFLKDMLGNGPGEKNWGMLNMILSDTMANPFTAHKRKSNMRLPYVDFITDSSDDDAPQEDRYLFLFADPPPTVIQYGAYPYKIAEWLQAELRRININANFNNDWEDGFEHSPRTYRELGINSLWKTDPDLTGLTDLGYNIVYEVDAANKEITFITKGRKKTPDARLKFRDNNKGQREWEDTDFLYGFNINMYLGAMQKVGGIVSNIGSPSNPVDATRIKIDTLQNLSLPADDSLMESMTFEEKREYRKARRQSLFGDDKVISVETAYEFLTVDNTFDRILKGSEARTLIEEYPRFTRAFGEKVGSSPCALLLQDLVAKNNTTSIGITTATNFCNLVSETVYDNLKNEIANNEAAFLYGAKYDNLTSEMYDYVVANNQTDSPGGTLYSEAEIDGRKITNQDAIMGISRDQYNNGNDARVFYLNPLTYGGKYVNPPLYVKPIPQEGWLSYIDIIFPDFSPCKPHGGDLINFEEIQKDIGEQYINMPEDDRLRSDPDCVTELPYNRILERSSKAAIHGLIKSACRIYASVHLIKSMATFTTFYPKFPENYSSLFAQYIVEDMEQSFKDAQGAAYEAFNPFKDSEFWYTFLEQSVQTYARLVDEGKIDPPKPVLQALIRINDMQEKYIYSFKRELKNAKRAGEIPRYRTLKNYREENKLEAIIATQDDAKIVLKEWVITELNIMGKRFVDNLKLANLEPRHSDLEGYFLTNFVGGAENLTLDRSDEYRVIGLPTSGDDHFTAGAEFTLPDGSEYVGYYHVHTTDDGEDLYMVGSYHTDDAHDTLTIMANRVGVPIGDIQDYDSGNTTSKLFMIEKYTKVEGVIRKPSAATAEITGYFDSSKNISDVYPGNLQEISVGGKVVGIAGELGVRHGLRFSAMISGKQVLRDVELDALDVKIGDYSPVQQDSKLLLCLINQLKDDSVYKMCVNYIFPLPKMLASLAIYNDMAFLSSIGEVTVAEGMNRPSLFPPNIPEFSDKPGTKVTFPNAADLDFTPDYSESVAGWASYDDRTTKLAWFVTKWDEWDRVLLRNSKSRIKKLFKTYYLSRDFDPARSDDDFRPGEIIKNNLTAAFRPASGGRLPWFRKRMLRKNVTNANGQICEKKE